MTANALSARQRVLRSIAGKDIDRVALMFRAEPELVERLRRELGVNDLETYFGSDLVLAETGLAPDLLPDLSRMDDPQDAARADWPDRSALNVEAVARKLADCRDTGRAVCGGMWASIFTHSRRIMGEARYLLAMLENPDLIHAVVERLADVFIDMNEALFSRCARHIDLYYFGSDFGTQASMFLSPEMYREFFKPPMRRIVEHAKGFELPVMFHTCGAVAPIIDDLIDIGVDVLDPVQVSAAGMAPEALAGRFRGRIAFHGGISSQVTLPRATPREVGRAVRHTIEALGPVGYICGPDQNMMEDTPLENIEALYREAREYKW